MADNKNTSLFILPVDALVVGKITSEGNARIEGRLEGEIEVQGDLTLGASAEVRGDVKSRNASIGGSVFGSVMVENLLEITTTGKLHGDIVTKDLRIEAGADFIGNSEHW
ncbi:MAG: polymer-forming cytoskeletal protein [Gracilibacteraceae bacterium]|jgi:cytoskeletal protein CcmA (bactofilin family)|nr:polymer-forming cytoskeletal protein [Gracilibacteraceae bacterium]